MAAVLNLVGLSLTAALPGEALVAGVIVAHATFVKAPVTDEPCVRSDLGVSGSAGRSIGCTAERSTGRSTGRSRTGGAD